MIDDTARDALEAAARERYPSDRYEGALTPGAIINARREAFVAGAMWMRENGYEKREPGEDESKIARIRTLLDTPTDERGITWWQWIDGGLGGSLHDDLRAILSEREPAEFAPGECTGAHDCDAPMHIHGCYRPHRADQCDAPEEFGHIAREPVVVDDATVWRNHPGLGGADGIGVRHPNGGGHQWYTVERARQVVAELSAGLAALTQDGQEAGR